MAATAGRGLGSHPIGLGLTNTFGDEESDDLWTVVKRHVGAPFAGKLASISTVVNIESVRYHSCMTRSADPDILLLQAIADPTRLAILRQLSVEGTVCACDFTDCCAVGQPTISHHLKVLREAGWVESERRGTWIYYSVRPEALGRLREIGAGLVPGIARPLSELTPTFGAASLPASQPGS